MNQEADIHESFDDAELEDWTGDDNGGAPDPEPVQGDPEAAQDTTGEGEAEAPAPEPSQEETPQAPPQGHVPYGALHEERQIRKELQGEVEALKEKIGTFSGLKEQLDALRNRQTREQQQADEAAFESDPVGYLKQKNDALQAKIEGQQKAQEDRDTATRKQQEQYLAQQREFNEFNQNVSQQVADFTQSHPDYRDAFQFFMQQRLSEYQALGMTDQNQLVQQFNAESIAISKTALQRGINPGQAVYDLAKLRGYVKSDGQQSGLEKEVNRQMDQLEKGGKAAQTLSGGGSAHKGDLTLADIENMDDAAFDALWDEMASNSIHE